jgi:hypothetical protein
MALQRSSIKDLEQLSTFSIRTLVPGVVELKERGVRSTAADLHAYDNGFNKVLTKGAPLVY